MRKCLQNEYRTLHCHTSKHTHTSPKQGLTHSSPLPPPSLSLSFSPSLSSSLSSSLSLPLSLSPVLQSSEEERGAERHRGGAPDGLGGRASASSCPGAPLEERGGRPGRGPETHPGAGQRGRETTGRRTTSSHIEPDHPAVPEGALMISSPRISSPRAECRCTLSSFIYAHSNGPSFEIRSRGLEIGLPVDVFVRQEILKADHLVVLL